MTLMQKIDYLNGLPLAGALWWFIENSNDDDKDRSELFFYLRERVRNNDPRADYRYAKQAADLNRHT